VRKPSDLDPGKLNGAGLRWKRAGAPKTGFYGANWAAGWPIPTSVRGGRLAHHWSTLLCRIAQTDGVPWPAPRVVGSSGRLQAKRPPSVERSRARARSWRFRPSRNFSQNSPADDTSIARSAAQIRRHVRFRDLGDAAPRLRIKKPYPKDGNNGATASRECDGISRRTILSRR
jgi:hypothetical protein